MRVSEPCFHDLERHLGDTTKERAMTESLHIQGTASVSRILCSILQYLSYPISSQTVATQTSCQLQLEPFRTNTPNHQHASLRIQARAQSSTCSSSKTLHVLQAPLFVPFIPGHTPQQLHQPHYYHTYFLAQAHIWHVQPWFRRP